MQQASGPLRDTRGGPSSFEGKLIAGVELGGTKCVCSLATAEGRIVDQQIVPTTSPAETIGAIELRLVAWNESGKLGSLGIASFGPVDLDPGSSSYGYITTTTKPGWQGTDIAQRLARATGLPASFDTDVNGAAQAEIMWGSGQGLADFAYITVGTGVGVGLIVNGKPTRGFAHSEMGHIRVPRLPWDDWPGACPFHGDCVEGLASGSALRARLGNVPVESLAETDRIWDSVAWTLAQLCHALVCTAAPRRIVIGGGVIEAQQHLLPKINVMLRESLAGYMAMPADGPYLRPPALGARAGQLGPIALALLSA